ncbi:hypothetical protein V9T40_009909 [Parthenolecanium corni]|uniref:Cytochrome b5 heme-binding domain-containing protein n=1 Tax=Parthenolecanium corni TaxID=536013 RepID=A0AAN9TYV1_9HEMI
MGSRIFFIILLLLVCYFYHESIVDIALNFGIYFPFLNTTTYLDLIKHVAIPKFKSDSDENLFTVDELKTYNGENSNLLYISILGQVFDVSKASSYYGVNQVYHGFTGRDASRAFVSGDFSELGLTDDVLDLPLQDLPHLTDWLKMYQSKYKYKGKLIGRFFDENGYPTEYNKEFQKRLLQAEKEKQLENADKELFPPCNVEWTADKGSRVWCTKKSGGIDRDWIGVPRKLFVPGSQTYRCACINISPQNSKYAMDTKFSEYDGCDSNSHSCFVET